MSSGVRSSHLESGKEGTIKCADGLEVEENFPSVLHPNQSSIADAFKQLLTTAHGLLTGKTFCVFKKSNYQRLR